MDEDKTRPKADATDAVRSRRRDGARQANDDVAWLQPVQPVQASSMRLRLGGKRPISVLLPALRNLRSCPCD